MLPRGRVGILVEDPAIDERLKAQLLEMRVGAPPAAGRSSGRFMMFGMSLLRARSVFLFG